MKEFMYNKYNMIVLVAYIILAVFIGVYVYSGLSEDVFIEYIDSLYVDNADFSFFFNLFIGGMNFVLCCMITFFYLLWSIFFSVVLSIILRWWSKKKQDFNISKYLVFIMLFITLAIIVTDTLLLGDVLLINIILINIPVPIFFYFLLIMKTNRQ